MSIKKIFEDGMKEFKRQSAYRREKRKLSEKEETYAEQLKKLGEKAWESKINMDKYGSLKELLTAIGTQIEELNLQLSKLKNQKEQLDKAKKEKNEFFNSKRNAVESKKKEVDTRLEKEQETLKEASRELEKAEDRLKEIQKDEEQFNTKVSDPQITDEEKTEIKKRLAGLDVERDELKEKSKNSTKKVEAQTNIIKPLESESQGYQQEIDSIKTEQKKIIDELDESISRINKQISDASDKIRDVKKEQTDNFQKLGEKLTADQVEDGVVASELESVNSTKEEIKNLQAVIQTLEQQKTAASSSAFWKMIGIVAAGLILIIAIIIALATIFGASDEEKHEVKSSEEVAEKIQDQREKDSQSSKSITTPEEAAKSIDTMTGTIKEQSEKLQGGKIVAADKETFLAALPDISGWTTENTSYNKGSFGQIETSNLSTTYVNSDEEAIDIQITDAATGSAMLRTYKLFIGMKMSKADEYGHEKVSEYNDIPVIEKYRKNPETAEFIYLLKDRYIVNLKSKGEGCLDRLKGFITKFNLSKLQ
jgi:hypothetical protein